MTRVQFRRLTLSAAAVLSIVTMAAPADAQFGGIVFDPRNFAQNVMTAARELQQINNQIQQIQNQATSLINQARNLASLPFSTVAQIQSQIQRTQQLLTQAQQIAYNVQSIQSAFTSRYGSGAVTGSDQALLDGAQTRWQTSVAGFEDALKTQATVVGNIDTSKSTMTTLVTASHNATGALQAAQAGNELLALQSQQLSDLTAAVAAQGRAQDLEAARQATAEAQGQEQYSRFSQRSTYQPYAVQAFHN
ncbi:P-type conjugative transfer protein TrbJ [Nostoc sp. 3335mG]|nr:P-type conjugative transfer protein TrbJ [Nostoc sp. 3335mG]